MQYNALQSIQAFEAGTGARKERERETAMKGIGNALAGGDWSGGAASLFKMGEFDAGMKAAEYGKGLQDAAAEEKRVGLIRYGMGLLNTPAPQREAMRGQIAQALGGMGIQLDEQSAAQMDLSDEGIRATLMTLQDTDGLMKMYEAQFAPPEHKVVGSSLLEIGPDGVKPVYTAPEKPQGPMSTIGKLRADLDAERITPEEYAAEVERIQRGQPSLSVEFGEGGALSGITYGSAPKGQESALVRTRDGSAAVSPGPQQEAYNKARRGVDEFIAQNSIVLGDIDKALEIVGPWSTGAGSVLKDLPVVGGLTPAGQMESLLETIRANVGFDKLQAMRESSPTGGALGNVTERELAFLQAVFGSMRQDLSPQNVTRNLQRLRQHMAGREQRIREAFAADFPTLEQTAQFRAETNQQVNDLNGLYAPDGDPVTEDDIQETMKKHGLSRAEVIARLRGQ